ncbi:MAG: sulfate adenylyltransferase, large subunit [Frankiales bacterium]|nr:sulfate adenylyltransferase, large subunit [Frankiales bacterium]
MASDVKTDFAVQQDRIANDIEAYLHEHEHKSLLRFITCGSVDDGKSTLIGRLLYESQMVFEDQLTALTHDSKTMGTQGGELDLALLVDGLAAEREQGITIDVAYRFFSTEKRKFIVADTPGHEQYTRNMVTGASTADLAIILIDARKGVLTQTRRHSYLVSLLGITKVVLAVNKVDAVGYSQDVVEAIDKDYRAFAAELGLTDITTIPTSALKGDNILVPSANTPWYDGPTLLGHLESVEVEDQVQHQPFRMPVQWVSRPDLDFRGFAGQIAGGSIRPGDQVRVLPSSRVSTVDRIVTFDGDLPQAVAGQSITLTLTDEVDVSRGDVLAAADDSPEVADQFEATLVWMAEEPLQPGRPYLLKIGARTVSATVGTPDHKVDVNTLEHLPADTLALNEIGVVQVSLDRAVPFDPYALNRDMGGFVLVDRLTNGTVGAGMLRTATRRADNVHWQAIDVDKSAHAALKGQKPCVLWFTGLPSAGKSTVANLVERALFAQGRHTYLLDGDNVRHGLNADLGFTAEDRVENIRRVGEVARLMVDAGLIVLVTLVSPYRADRDLVRSRLDEGEFFEVFVDAPLAVVQERDPKGLYRKAAAGEAKNVTGVDAPYEAPESPELRLPTAELSADDAARKVLAMLTDAGILAP